VASLDQSLKRMGLEYVDIFYHHRMDPDTPLEETMSALAQAVKSGKALYVGISNYSPEAAYKASAILNEMGVHCLICQSRYNMLDRKIETDGLFRAAEQIGMGITTFSPLAQGILTGKYNNGIPGRLTCCGKIAVFDKG
jgi:L-glyceraldehyde 3-phosphate reductase